MFNLRFPPCLSTSSLISSSSQLASAASLINTVAPFVSGALIDWFGPEWSSLVASCSSPPQSHLHIADTPLAIALVAFGSVVAGIGASKSSYGVLLSGEIIVGLGTVTLETAQTKIYTYWFYGQSISEGTRAHELMVRPCL